MPLPWFRVHRDLLNNRKYQLLPDLLKARLLNIWCLAAKYDGVLPAEEDAAFELRLTEDELRYTIEQLKSAGFLDWSARGLTPHDWTEHQCISDISTGRVKRFRAKAKQRRRNGPEAARKRDDALRETQYETDVKRSCNGPEQSRVEQKRAEENTPKPLGGARGSDVESPNRSPNVRHGEVESEIPAKKPLLNPELEIAVDRVSKQIHDRHPAIRRCGIGQIKEKLRAILRRVPSNERPQVLVRIDGNHEAWCQTDQWTKDDGQFAKGLENWLAPTKERWEEVPPSPTQTENDPPKLFM